MKLFSEAFGRQGLLLQKHSPTLFFVGGVAGMIGSTVLACTATLKLEEVLKETNENLDKAKDLEHEDYSEQDRKKDIAIIYTRAAVKVGKLYGPAIVVGGLSVAALTQSHNILTRRNAALAAAYSALDKGFRQYRARVVEKYGEEEDRNFRYGTELVTIPNEKGKDETFLRAGPEACSIYARFFDETATEWKRDRELNALFLKCQQNYANDLLHSRGHVFLNEVYDMLGIGRSRAGAVVGWLLNPAGDNYVDFGVFNGQDSYDIRDFVNGREGSVLLDFNVDGVIFDKIDTPVESPKWHLNS